jgi:hypothetical protein
MGPVQRNGTPGGSARFSGGDHLGCGDGAAIVAGLDVLMAMMPGHASRHGSRSRCYGLAVRHAYQRAGPARCAGDSGSPPAHRCWPGPRGWRPGAASWPRPAAAQRRQGQQGHAGDGRDRRIPDGTPLRSGKASAQPAAWITSPGHAGCKPSSAASAPRPASRRPESMCRHSVEVHMPLTPMTACPGYGGSCYEWRRGQVRRCRPAERRGEGS